MTLFFILGVLAAVVYWMVGGGRPPRKRAGEIIQLHSPESSPRTTVRVLSWNLAYAHGEGSAGPGYQVKDFRTYTQTLQRMASVIREARADIVLLQECDFNANRSQSMDQLLFLQQAAGFPQSARALTWEAGHIPYPYWPLRAQFGRMNSGGGVLSRFPITLNHVTLLDKPAAMKWFMKPFYLYRFSQEVMVQIGQDNYWFVNNHWEAFERECRKGHAEKVVRLIEKNPGKVIAFGGDLNTIPPHAKVQHGFPGIEFEDYRGDETWSVLSQMKGFREAIPMQDYDANESKYFTFPAHAPDRRLDYLFVRDECAIKSFEILRGEALSDHCPIVAEIALGYPRNGPIPATL